MAELPWQYSQDRKRRYIYSTERDELVFDNGQTTRRPSNLSRRELTNATYEGEDIDNIITLLRYRESKVSPPAGSSERYTTATKSDAARAQTDASDVPRTAVPYTVAGPSNQYASVAGLTTGLRDMRLASTAPARGTAMTDLPQGALIPNPENNDELIARVNISRGRGSSQDGPPTNIASAEVVGGQTEKLYPEYKQREKKFFFVGKVFSILWSEPSNASNTVSGTSANTVVTQREEAIITGPFGEPIFSKIRRFVVIRQADGYCNAVPIMTYGGKGVSKRHAVKSEHAVIYTAPLKPILAGERPNRDEEPMRSIPIRVDPDTKADKLDPTSRVNFGHPHTIQYNVKVKSCGKVAQESMQPLLTQFTAVFQPNTPTSGSSASRAYTSASASAGPSASSATTSTADDKVSVALQTLIDSGLSRTEAVRRMLEALQANGLSAAGAAELIRKALT